MLTVNSKTVEISQTVELSNTTNLLLITSKARCRHGGAEGAQRAWEDEEPMGVGAARARRMRVTSRLLMMCLEREGERETWMEGGSGGSRGRRGAGVPGG